MCGFGREAAGHTLHCIPKYEASLDRKKRESDSPSIQCCERYRLEELCAGCDRHVCKECNQFFFLYRKKHILRGLLSTKNKIEGPFYIWGQALGSRPSWLASTPKSTCRARKAILVGELNQPGFNWIQFYICRHHGWMDPMQDGRGHLPILILRTQESLAIVSQCCFLYETIGTCQQNFRKRPVVFFKNKKTKGIQWENVEHCLIVLYY